MNFLKQHSSYSSPGAGYCDSPNTRLDDHSIQAHHHILGLNSSRLHSSSSRDSQQAIITRSSSEITNNSARQEDISSSDSLEHQIDELGISSNSVRDLVCRINSQIVVLDKIASGKSKGCNISGNPRIKSHLESATANNHSESQIPGENSVLNSQVNAVIEEMQVIFADLKVL